MLNAKRSALGIIMILSTFSNLEAQTTPDQKEPFQSYLLIPNRLLAASEPKNEVFFDPMIGNYTIGKTGVTTTDGHLYHIRIKEPDLTKVIPMPGTNQASAAYARPFQSYAPSFHLLPPVKIPPPRQDR